MQRPILLFAGTYDPGCGWEDLRGTFATITDAFAFLPLCRAWALDWFQIVNLHTMQILARGALTDLGIGVQTDELVVEWRTFVVQQGHGLALPPAPRFPEERHSDIAGGSADWIDRLEEHLREEGQT